MLVGAEIHPADVKDRDGAVLMVEALRSPFPWLRRIHATAYGAVFDEARICAIKSGRGVARATPRPDRAETDGRPSVECEVRRHRDRVVGRTHGVRTHPIRRSANRAFRGLNEPQ